MRNRYLHIIAFFAAALAAAACEFRPMYIEGETPVEVIVKTDWVQLGSKPEGSSIYFYPEDGTEPKVFLTNSVTRTSVKVPSGYYTVMVFNRSESEFGSLKFGDMESLGTGRAILEDKLFPWVGRADTIGRTVYEPEEFVVGRTDHFLVRSMAERETYLWQQGIEITGDNIPVIDSVLVTPQRVRYVGNVKIRIYGINNLKSMRAYLTGMGGDAYLATRAAGENLATHVFDTWTKSTDESDETKGYVNSSFHCFGLPEQYIGNRKDMNNKILLQFRLVDNKTIIQHILYVGDLIVQNDKERTDDLVIETAITLPDVKPEGGRESGFDVHFTDWDDPEDVTIGM